MRKIVRASVLILAVSCTAYAGVMPFPVIEPEPTPTPAQASTQESTAGNTQGQSAEESTAAEAVLSLVTGVLALF